MTSFLLMEMRKSGRTGSAVITWLTIPFLACAIALEALGIYYLGDDLLWWMDQKVYGFGPAAGGALLGSPAIFRVPLPKDHAQPEHEERQIGYPSQLCAEAFHLGVE